MERVQKERPLMDPDLYNNHFDPNSRFERYKKVSTEIFIKKIINSEELTSKKLLNGIKFQRYTRVKEEEFLKFVVKNYVV